MRTIVISFAALALANCATTPRVASGTPTAALGQVANIGNLRIVPLKIIEDSRCPANVQCVWAGRLVIRVEIEAGAGADHAELTLGKPLGVGGVLTLIAADPPRITGAKFDPRDYRFTFDYEGRP